jgi:nucleoside-diphosphate kinase
MSEESTLVLVKPDGVERHLTGRVLQRLHDAGLDVAWIKFCHLTYEAAADLYREHRDKRHFHDLVTHMSSPHGVVALMVFGQDAVACARLAVEHIRHDLAMDRRCNVVHASSSLDEAKRELALMFGG